MCKLDFTNVFYQRFVPIQDIENFFQGIDFLSGKVLGTSSLLNPIRMYRFGQGDFVIKAWSLMHGNESTAIRALANIFKYLKDHPEKRDSLSKKITLEFISVLNPDGAERWSRLNAQNLDINRDFNKEQTPEMKILKSWLLSGQTDLALNLHDQRNRFGVNGLPATLSLLSPSYNEKREINSTRLYSMEIINALYANLKTEWGKRIGRFSDEFYPEAVGDNLVKCGIHTMLLEAGHYENDLPRRETTLMMTEALWEIFQYSSPKYIDEKEVLSQYLSIPENENDYYDIAVEDYEHSGEFYTLGIRYEERLEQPELKFIPKIEIISKESLKAWEVLQFQELKSLPDNFIAEVGMIFPQ